MRLAILWEQWFSYTDVCLRDLMAHHDVRVFRVCARPRPEAPVNFDDFITVDEQHFYDQAPEYEALLEPLEAFQPDLILVTSWNRPAYRKLMRRFRHRAVRVTIMDNQWLGTPKQYLGRLSAPFFVRRLFDAVLAAGPRQEQFAARLGFPKDRIRTPCYSCDPALLPYEATLDSRSENRHFLYVGRLVDDKNFPRLVAAFQAYCEQMGDTAWSLKIAGAGALAHLIKGPKMQYLGYLTGVEIYAAFGRASGFILPSLFEPWGVVLHEAAAAGLPIICSPQCGASTRFLMPGKNGFLIDPKEKSSITDAFVRLSQLDNKTLNEFSRQSRALGLSITPRNWSCALLNILKDCRA